MRNILALAIAALLLALNWQAVAAGAQRKTTTAKKPASSTAKKTTKATSKRKKAAPKVTWRNRQLAPGPERYKEIQEALVAKGYLKSEEADGTWNVNCTDALKRFQTDQHIDANGKINSLSLIALGLGPKHDAEPVKPPAGAPADANR